MLSPVAKNTKLVRDQLEIGFTVFRCPESHGIWIPPKHYWAWRDKHSDKLEALEPENAEPTMDSAAGKRCPEDGAFLIRHRVGYGLNFHIDRCGHCGGIWLDANEWDALKAHNLQESMHLIFTSSWQAKVREQDRAIANERLLREHLGDADFDKATTMRQWIDTHPKKPMITAYLQGTTD